MGTKAWITVAPSAAAATMASVVRAELDAIAGH